MQQRLQLRRAPATPHRMALQMLVGETGLTALMIVLVVTGVGVLADFLIFNVHPILSVGLLLASIPTSLYWTVRKTLMTGNRTPNPEYVRNLALATVAGQAGCFSVILIFAALFAGMFLDSRLDTHPVFTIGLVIVSIPLNLYAMIRMMLSSVSAIHHPEPAATASDTASNSAADSSLTKENGA